MRYGAEGDWFAQSYQSKCRPWVKSRMKKGERLSILRYCVSISEKKNKNLKVVPTQTFSAFLDNFLAVMLFDKIGIIMNNNNNLIVLICCIF